MENAYDIHQHTHCVVIHIEKKDITLCIIPNSNRHFYFSDLDKVRLGAFVTYDGWRIDDARFGRNSEIRFKDNIVIGYFRDGLYNFFKNDKETWDEEDGFFMQAFSNYLSLAVKKTMERARLEIENFDLFHYAFIVPSEWEEEIRDDIIRPIFVQSGLISNEDHRDRLLFFTDIEAICYNHSFERGDNTILCRLTPEEEKVIIKFDLIQTRTTLFNFPTAKLFPKVMKSISVITDDVESRIKDYLRTNLFPVATTDDGGLRQLLKRFFNPKLAPSVQDQIIEAIIEGINSESFPSLDNEKEENYSENRPWITFKKEWKLDENQKEFIKSLRPSIICAEIGSFLFSNFTDIISNNFTKSYRFLLVTDNYSGWNYSPKNGLKWLKYILEYNSCSLNPNVITITRTDSRENEIGPKLIFKGTGIGVFEAIKNSDMYCKPRIVSPEDLITSSSVFLHSKPDVIINLDISLGSTVFTCSFLDEEGSIQQIFDHGYFIGDKHLPPVGHFYTFSNTTTLNVKEKFILFAERYLLGDLSDLIADDGVSINKDLLLEMKAILTNDLSNREVLVSTNKKKYIKAFILMYMIYIKEEILYKLPEQLISDQMDLKIGYAVSIESILLNNTMETKDNLRDIIYESGLVPKGNHSKKIRITTQGEGTLPAIQKSLKLELSLKSYFLLCQLHEDYVQLSLHQVVTEPSSEEKEQESIIVQDEILAIQNIYDSLCLNMWCNLLQDSSLIELCEMHNISDNDNIINLFSPKTKTEFFANLKGHISDNVLQNNHGTGNTHAVNLNSSCNCKVRLATSDILNVCFTPVLQDIASTLSASLLNKELFRNYMNIDYLFSFIRFNNNPQLQYAFAKILEEEADDFNLELGIETSCLVIPELFSHLLYPVITQRSLCYKDFKFGALQQVCSENYIVYIIQNKHKDIDIVYKSKPTDKEIIEYGYNIGFPFLSKGDTIDNCQSNRTLYLRNDIGWLDVISSIEVYRFKTMDYLKNDKTLFFDDNVCQRVDKATIEFSDFLFWNDVNVPVMVSVKYVSYISSLQFSLRSVGADAKDELLMGVVEAGEPLTLTRF